MSVRLGILAVLSMGQAYGLQVHGELESRMNRPGKINVGQIYSTIERLQSRGLVIKAGSTPDGLPLYEVTASGRIEVDAWLSFEDVVHSDWGEMVSHVLMATSMPGRSALPVVAGYRARFEGVRAEAARIGELDLPQRRLGALGDTALAEAAIRWLDQVSTGLGAPAATSHQLVMLRPRRGRRPAGSQ